MLSPEGAKLTVSPLQGSVHFAPLTQGFGRFAACALGFAISRFQRLEYASSQLGGTPEIPEHG
jgi:hypothetical protein